MLKITDEEFELFRGLIKKKMGINLSTEKKSLVFSRLRPLIAELELSSFSEYYETLLKDKNTEITKSFMDRISTNHTFFMREASHFEYFKNVVLPKIELKHKGSKDIRLWCAACSSGEEAYTLQILLQEYFEDKPSWNLEILATDISNNVLNKAYKGVYPKESIDDLPVEWRKKYFEKFDEFNMVAKPILRKNITFSRFNFIEDEFNFKKPFQVIFCRNAMIYFDTPTRNILVKKFYSVTEDSGYLFIGQSESLGHADSEYKYLLPAVYQK
ncbi:MAG: protein-glutamate O-methyltransferase CheR [Defluviitaleaceae bacterium]|nr:protein-glutamate O-methyltransferase CheR [Defluviitaleaceae bacterium]